MASRIFEPSPRWSHLSAAVKGELYVYGGVTDYVKVKPDDSPSVHIFNQHVESWQTRSTTGHHPPGLFNGICTSSVVSAAQWSQEEGWLWNGCLPRQADSVWWLGYLTYPIQPGAEFVKDDRYSFNGGWTNELHSFDIKERKWSSPLIRGRRPPPCSCFTLTKIDDHHAVLFGGNMRPRPKLEKSDQNYVLDLTSMTWQLNSSHLNSSHFRPVGRDYHAAVCLDFGEDSPHLLITGGRDKNNVVLGDVWLLDVWAKQWKEVFVSSHHQPRFRHSATAFSLSEKVTEVTIFGGCPVNHIDFEETGECPVLADTTVLRFEKQITQARSSVSVSLGFATENQWVLNEVANSSQLGQSLRIAAKKFITHSTEHHAQDIFIAIGDLILFQENIGNGAFAAVHRAEYKGEVCAAKMLHQHARDMLIGRTPHGAVQDAAKLSIQKECSFLESLQHKNIVRHITTAIEPRFVLPILVMELMDCSLKQFISTDKPLDLDLQLTICHGVSSGLHYLHTEDIIHRDLCDDNVLLTQPPNLKVKISDFGMSKILDYDSMSATMTAVGHRRGYLPPEGEDMNSSDEDADDYYDKARYSHHLDIYSFGAVATQTVQSADHLKSRIDLKRAFKQVAKDHPLKEIIAKCIEKDSKLRPQACFIRDFITSQLS